LAKVDKTEEWKDWLDMKPTRDIAKKEGHTFPIYMGWSDSWMVFHPWADIYMEISHDDYFQYRELKRIFKSSILEEK